MINNLIWEGIILNKDYNIIIEAIKYADIYNRNASIFKEALIEKLCESLKSNDLNFDCDRFIDACYKESK